LDSIVADNPSGSDFYGSFGALTDGGDNVSSDSSFPFSAAGSMNNTDPKLGLLGSYGGATPTIRCFPAVRRSMRAAQADTQPSISAEFPGRSGLPAILEHSNMLPPFRSKVGFNPSARPESSPSQREFGRA